MVTSRPFGAIQGKAVTAYTIENKNGMRLTVIDYGARIASILLPDGREAVLGFDDAEGYGRDTASIGAICGRYANRISNATFTLHGVKYDLDRNDGNNTLHGGVKGFAYRMYEAKTEEDAVLLSLVSPDGDNGFPGEFRLTVRYALSEDDAVHIGYFAETSRDTVMNLTNHAYFNLAGGGPVYEHRLRVNASYYVPTGEDLMPTGEILSVKGTPLDLREGIRLGDTLDPLDPFLAPHLGYDNTFALDRTERGTLEYAATLTAPDGLRMDCYTTEPSIQVYTANYLDEPHGRGGQSYGTLNAVCLETQVFPDSMRYPYFPSPVIKAGRPYRSETVYRFTR